MKSTVLILMATYNGEKYLSEQIDSIVRQSFSDWKLIISDDASSDATENIIKKYCDMYPGKIEQYISGQRFGCATKHFLHLIENLYDADYIMLSDQDDVWHKNKIELTLQEMKQLERIKGEGVPLLVFTDLTVVDENLRCIQQSMMRNYYPDLTLSQRLVCNNVSGCTLMMNKDLVKLVRKGTPLEGVKMHDWWIACIAASLGSLSYVRESTIDYRQHLSNSVGVRHDKQYSYSNAKDQLNALYKQAEALKKQYGEGMKRDAYLVIENFLKIQYKPKFLRIFLLIKGRYNRGSLISTIRLLYIC